MLCSAHGDGDAGAIVHPAPTQAVRGLGIADPVGIDEIVEILLETLIEQPASKSFTLLALAIECGFSSKSSFNKFFKKSTGKTPSEFMKSI